MKLFRYLVSAVASKERDESPKLDTTEYRITTKSKIHVGTIMYQSDLMIKFKNVEGKSITILKSNIEQIKMAFKIID